MISLWLAHSTKTGSSYFCFEVIWWLSKSILFNRLLSIFSVMRFFCFKPKNLTLFCSNICLSASTYFQLFIYILCNLVLRLWIFYWWSRCGIVWLKERTSDFLSLPINALSNSRSLQAGKFLSSGYKDVRGASCC